LRDRLKNDYNKGEEGESILSLAEKVELIKENSNLKDMVRNLTNKTELLTENIDDLEQYSKGMNLLIHGIPVAAQTPGSVESDLDSRIITFINSNLGTTLTDLDVNIMHRLAKSSSGNGSLASGQSATNSQLPASKPPPILIQFTSKKIRNLILNKRKLLKGKRVSITEQLTPKKALLL